MSDVASIYTLTTPGGTVVFNDFDLYTEQDGLWLTDVSGLEPDMRIPRFNKPVTHGSRILPGFFTGLTPAFVGEYVIQSTRVMDEIRAHRNTMRRELRAVLRAAIDADGTLTWAEPVDSGTVNMSLTVRFFEKLVTGFENSFAVKTFAFSLASEADAPSES